MRALLVNLGRVALSLGLLAWLVHDLRSADPRTFAALLAEPKRWPLLVAGWACFLLALGAGLARWQLLARAVGLACRPAEALRIGVLAYTLDFVALGAAGGDLFKALSLRRVHGGRGVHALTTVVADRLVGLGTLVVVAGTAAFFLGATALPGAVPLLSRLVTGLALAAVVGAAALGLLRRHARALQAQALRLPVVGGHLANLLDAVSLYGSNPGTLARAAILGFAVHGLNIAGFALLAHGLSPAAPGLAAHCLIVPLASLSGIVPLPADTLGVLDYALNLLYAHVSAGQAPAGLGLLVAMTYRVVGVALSSVGIVLYLAAPGVVRETMRRAARGEGGPAPANSPPRP